MKTRNIITLSLLTSAAILISSCAAHHGPTGDEIYNIKPVHSPEYGFKVSIALADADSPDLQKIDNMWTNYEKCIKEKIGMELDIQSALAYHYYIVEDSWRCIYHDWCYGEISTDSKRVWVSRLGLKQGLLEHEWAHLYRIVDSKDKLRKSEYAPATRCFYDR